LRLAAFCKDMMFSSQSISIRRFATTVQSARSAACPEYHEGDTLVMGFGRRIFSWSIDHVPCHTIAGWECEADVADVHFRPGMTFEEFENNLHGESSLPDWVDMAKVEQGCKFIVELWPYITTTTFGTMLGLLGYEGISLLLQQTYTLPKDSAERSKVIWRVAQEAFCWLFDVAACGKEGFKPGGSAWNACLQLRFLNCKARSTLKATSWDEQLLQQYGEPINQCQLMIAVLASSALLLQQLEEFHGIHVPDESKEALIHLWRVVGFLVWVNEDINPNTSYKHATVVMESIFSQCIEPFPDISMTGKLTTEICASMSENIHKEYVTMLPITAGTVAVPGWFFLGEAYASALGLPAPSWSAWTMGVVRIYALKALLMLSSVSGSPQGLEHVMHFFWRTVVLSIQKRLPNCMFGHTGLTSEFKHQDCKEPRYGGKSTWLSILHIPRPMKLTPSPCAVCAS